MADESLPQVSLPLVADTGIVRRRKISRSAAITIGILIVMGVVGQFCMPQILAGIAWLSRSQPGPNYLDENPQLTEDQKLMYALSHVGGAPAVDAVNRIVEKRDLRFVPVLIEMLAAGESQYFMAGAGAHVQIKALERLTNQNFRTEARNVQRMAEFWSQWYITTDIEPPEGFVGWKGDLLSSRNHLADELLRDGVPVDIRVEEIHVANLRRTLGPSLIQPKTSSAKESLIEDDDPVYGVRVNGRSRAYPQGIVDWHHTINDVVGELPIALSCCENSGAAACFERRDPERGALTLHPSGLVYRGNELLYDGETRSLWCQMTGRPVLGAWAASGRTLPSVPVVACTWGEWKSEHPDTDVLSSETGFDRDYRPGAARGNYFSAEHAMYPVFQPSDLLPAKSRVYGLTDDSSRRAKAYPVAKLAESRVVNDTVGETPFVLVATNGLLNVEYRRRRNVAKYIAGGEVRAYRRGTETFRPSDDAETVLDGQGRRWEITEEALVGPNNQTLPRVAGTQSFWFGWHAIHPYGEVYTAQ